MELEDMQPGELVYGDAVFKFKLKGKTYKKTMYKMIISRKYEGNWPKLDNSEDGLIIGKLVDRKKRYDITEVEIIGLNVLARTGYINKKREAGDYKASSFKVEKQTRLDNGSFV